MKPFLTKCEALYAVNGTKIEVLGKSEIKFLNALPIPVIVTKTVKHDMILGADALAMGRAQIFLNANDLKMKWFDKMYKLNNFEKRHVPTIAETSGHPVIDEIIDDYKIVFEKSRVNNATARSRVECTIPTGDSAPIKQKAYRLPLRKRYIVQEQVREMLEAGVIRPSDSPYASPITLVPKKDNTWRFCIDYRRLNSVTRKDSFPLPAIQDIFDSFHGASIFSTLDLKTGYWQIPVAERDIEKTAFTCSEGLFEFTKMPFGLTNNGAIFQRYMTSVLRDYIGKFVFVYIDDIVIYSHNVEQHAEHLRLIFEKLEEHGLQLKRSKCTFASSKVDLLGYTISGDGISPQEQKVAAVRNMMPPKTVTEVRSFLGACGYYRGCVQNYAEIAGPLVELTRKYTRFNWGPRQQEAFQRLKDVLCSDTVLAYPDPSKPYKLYTDASDYAVGAILTQTDENGLERVIQYVSSTLRGAQINYAVIEKEAYAVVYALEKLRPYLFGADFVIYTDHKPLKSLFLKEVRNTRIQRWAVLIEEYGAPIRYIEGKKNVYADMLSRSRTFEINTFDTCDFIVPENEDPVLPHIPVQADDIDPHQLAEEQKKDYEKMFTDLPDDVAIHKNLLYSTRRPTPTDIKYPRLLLPVKFRPQVLHEAHERSGHQSVAKTLSHVRDAYVWAGMRKDVQSVVDKCGICQVNKKVTTRAQYTEMSMPSYPGEIIGIDLIGPLVESDNNNKYVLTVVDHYSAWAEAFPIQRKTAAAVEKALFVEYFPRHGIPRIIISDQGSEFNAHHLRSKFAAVGIDHRRTTPYHPQTNGQTERFNRTLKDILRRLVNNDNRKWEDQLANALTAYRNTTHSTTGFTPFYLTYGRRARLPLSLPVDMDQGIDDRIGNLAKALRVAKEMTAKSRQYHRQQINRRATRNDFKVGDTVVVKAGESITLTAKNDPQYEIYRLRLPVAFIRHQLTGKERIVNINKLRIVDPQIAWDTVNPRPIRNTRPLPAPDRLLDVYRNVPHQTVQREREPDDPPIVDDVSNEEAEDTISQQQDIADDDVADRLMEVEMPTNQMSEQAEKRPCRYPLRSRQPAKRPRLDILGFGRIYVINKYL